MRGPRDYEAGRLSARPPNVGPSCSEVTLPDSVHDNWVYAQAVDHDRRRIVLYTVFPHATPPEYTDVVFEGVVTHHFEQQNVGGGDPYPANVLFDVEESDAGFVLGKYTGLLARTKNHGWPVKRYDGLPDLVARLTAGGAKCFEVQGTVGVHGFVFAGSMTLRERPARAEIVT